MHVRSANLIKMLFTRKMHLLGQRQVVSLISIWQETECSRDEHYTRRTAARECNSCRAPHQGELCGGEGGSPFALRTNLYSVLFCTDCSPVSAQLFESPKDL